MNKRKQKDPGNLGKSLLRDKVGRKCRSTKSFLHTSELQDGQDWNRINFKSITEQTDIDNFLSTAELAGLEFKTEKMNIKYITPSSMIGVLTHDERTKILNAQEANKCFLRIPRRPPWDRSMSQEELDEAERDSFLIWRRSLSQLQEREGITLTPYEKNIEFWRQLWRVIERSDVVVQIVDARNPLLFYCEDLHQYVKELNAQKEAVILVNKADFLTSEQRAHWAEYFESTGLKSLFYSAIQVTKSNSVEDSSPMSDLCVIEDQVSDTAMESDHLALSQLSRQSHQPFNKIKNEGTNHCSYVNSSELLSREQLIDAFNNFNSSNSSIVIGLVGYPNVGKSSTINSLLEEKKVSVSATPGKTKHFQTIFLTDKILLCDCPGLVFPAFVSTKEEMIISGILPIDQMRDHVPPVNLLLSLIPRQILESTYGIRIPLPLEGEDMKRPPTSEEFLNVYGYMRGFMTPRGIPDHPRSSRYVLKDFINGRLLYCHAPPDVLQEAYHHFKVEKVKKANLHVTPHQRAAMAVAQTGELIDETFYREMRCKPHIKGSSRVGPNEIIEINDNDLQTKKPWRTKPDRRKGEKARRKFAHLDR